LRIALFHFEEAKMIKHLILARHGYSDWNAAGKIQGHKGGPLNGSGMWQARNLGQRFRFLSAWHPQVAPIGKLISSDLTRASETACVIADSIRGGYRPEGRLRECSFGKLEGLTYHEAATQYGQEVLPQLENWHGDYDFRPYGGECKQEVLDRQLHLLNSIAAGEDIATVLFVGHGRSLNTLIEHLWPGTELIVKNCDYRILPM
jgi:broad specificity phosphatase PhoE